MKREIFLVGLFMLAVLIGSFFLPKHQCSLDHGHHSHIHNNELIEGEPEDHEQHMDHGHNGHVH